jgi:hypothetical protein
MVIGRKGREPSVPDRRSDGEMVKVLEGIIIQAEDVMNDIVEETSHPRPPHSAGLGIEIEHLPDHAGFPVKPPVIKRVSFDILPEK